MKCIILAGGKGSRLSEYTKKIPKPMVKIGGSPILDHIIKYLILWLLTSQRAQRHLTPHPPPLKLVGASGAVLTSPITLEGRHAEVL